MQFYIIHKEPNVSAKLLPDYAIKKVNVREGWQILSDIGHRYGISWNGQNKEYSRSHALTMELSSSPEKFMWFVDHYRACCEEYYNRFGTMRKETEHFADLDALDIIQLLAQKMPANREQSVIRYMLETKTKHLTDVEIEDMMSLEN